MSGEKGEYNEKLIDLVPDCSFLYDLRHPDYKDAVKKGQAWRDIAEKLHLNIDTVKLKWKNLRDSYVKYLKYLKGATGSAKKIKNWPWAAHLEFLKDTTIPRPTATNAPESSETELIQADKSTNDASSVNNDEGSVTNDGGATGNDTASVAYDDSLMPPPQKKKAKPKEDRGDVDKILSYLQKKNDNKRTTPQLDHTDNLFLSYADTFKKLSPRSQAIIKMEMAQMFGRAELRDMDAQTTPPFSPLPHSSNVSWQSSSDSQHSLSGYTDMQCVNQPPRVAHLGSPTDSARDWYETFTGEGI